MKAHHWNNGNEHHLIHGRARKGRVTIQQQMFYNAKSRAKKDGLPFTITPEDVQIPAVCPVLGITLAAGTRRDHWSAPSLDKVIPELGYTPRNVRVISHRANVLKSNSTADELEKIAAYMRQAAKEIAIAV